MEDKISQNINNLSTIDTNTTTNEQLINNLSILDINDQFAVDIPDDEEEDDENEKSTKSNNNTTNNKTNISKNNTNNNNIKNNTNTNSINKTKKTSEAFEISFSKKSDVGASEILENFLYLGAGRDANDVEYIKSMGITHVLCMVSGWRPRVAYSDISVNFLHLPISDTPMAHITTLFPRAIEFITLAKDSQAKILVHCAAGISRSSTIVLAYLMKTHSMSLRQAYDLVYAKRSIIRPNTGFFDQLMKWEVTLHGTCSMTPKDLATVAVRIRAAPTFTPSKTLEIEEGMKWASTVVTEDLLRKVFQDVCGGKYMAEKTSDFLDTVLLITKNDPSVNDMQKKGYKWPKLSINLMRTASNWYKAKKDAK